MKRLLSILLLLVCASPFFAQTFSITDTQSDGAFPIYSTDNAAQIVYDSSEPEVVKAAATAVISDIKAITGKRLSLRTTLTSGTLPIIAGTIGSSSFIDTLVASGKLDVSAVAGKWEAYGLKVVDNPAEGIDKALVVYGSQSRSTAYALFEISREAGVSPWIWWADVAPKTKSSLWASGEKVVDEPSVKYRGIFINDEDFGLQPWAAKNMDTDKNNIGPKTYAKVMELLLRLRANTLWPAMHACSAAFWYYKDNIPVAKKYDIYLGSSHCEQMLRDNEWEWNRYGGHYNDDWNWKTNREMVQNYWAERVGESRGVDAIYTIGMRGVHDSGMNGYSTTSERVAALTEIMDWQRQLLSDSIGDPTKVPQLFIPYKEVLDCYNAGLKVPDDVILMWVDDNHGYIRQLPNATEQQRSGGNAIYYHLSYWGTPASYLWLSSISPSLCSFELTKAYQQGVRSQWIINVGDIKPAEEELEFCMDLAWDVDSWSPEKAWQYTRYWAAKTFGEEYADKFAEIKLAYYNLAAAGKPEHVHINSYTLEEMDARIAAYEELEKKVNELKTLIPSELQDAYFELLEYPVKAASDMNKKHFLAQKSLKYAQAGHKDEALEYASEAKAAYNQIITLTDKYNNDIASGKWNGIMSYHPQDLSQFYMPAVATASSISSYETDVKKTDYTYVSGGAYIESSGNVITVKGLGVSNETAFVWPEATESSTPEKAPYAIYEVPVKAGTNIISVRCLPTFPLNSSFNLRVAASIDGSSFSTQSVKTVAMEGAWNRTVAQGYSPADFEYESTEDKTIAVKVAFLDPGVAVSQIVAYQADDDVNELTRNCIVNYDFEMDADGNENDGTTKRGVPYGWTKVGQMSGNSYGINNDAIGYHGKNVCWMNSSPMPDGFTLYQTIPSSKLGAGTYKVSCLLWMEEGKKANGRLFANNNVEYYGYPSDYTNLLTSGEVNTYAGYAGLPTSNMTVREMEVFVTLADGEDLTIGIKSGRKKNDGTLATDNVGWFKVDFFRIEKIEDTRVHSLPTNNDSTDTNNIYNMCGQKVGDTYADSLPSGIYIKNGNKILKQ